MKSKNHKVLPNISLLPENDPTVLFNIAGVQPIVPYIMQGSHPLGKRLCSVQRCIRTIDIEETGDNRHLTFFEMLGNWSLGDYFKKEALNWSIELLIDHFNLDPNRIYASVFIGEDSIPQDNESIEIWTDIYKRYGIKAEVFNEDKNNDNARIFLLNKNDNFWGPAGQTGPCGPSSEIFYRFSKKEPDFSKSRPGFNDDIEYIELWNDVFMEFEKTSDGKYIPLKQKNVDTGAGFERICLVLQNRKKDGSIPKNVSVFQTDLFDTPKAFLQSLIEDESKISTLNENTSNIVEFDYTLTDIKNVKQAVKSFRIILDHMRSCIFLIADGVTPSNKDQGYILRRLIRRAIRHAKLLNIKQNFTREISKLYIDKYKIQYPHLEDKKKDILNKLEKEEICFEKVIERGAKEIDKLESKGKKITGKDLFHIYETYGFPIEMALDELGIEKEEKRKHYTDEFKKAKKSHQIKSRKGASGKFKSGLADHTEISKRYHTATHLLLKALQIVLGDHVHQRGSNITEKRLRFDFSHNKKLTQEEIKQVENIVNEKIKQNLVVEKEKMKKEDAIKTGAEFEFPEKYPDMVTVYTIKNSKDKSVFSREFCCGPHVKNTGELAKAGKFIIIKQESVSSGTRRIKAIIG